MGGKREGRITGGILRILYGRPECVFLSNAAYRGGIRLSKNPRDGKEKVGLFGYDIRSIWQIEFVLYLIPNVFGNAFTIETRDWQGKLRLA